MQRHHWRKLKPRPRHPKADPDEASDFQRSFEQQVRQIVQHRDPQAVRPVLIMASDEGRFGRTGEVRTCWCPPGVRARIAKQQVRQYLYAFTAVAPALGKVCSLVLPFANTAMMNLFLQHLSSEFAQYFIVLQLERAGWPRAKHLEVPENIRLLPQPAYSPELMPVEHIWEEIRAKHFYNRIFNSLDAVEATLALNSGLKNLK